MRKTKPLGIQIIALIFLANFAGTYYWVKTQSMASSCMTLAQVQNDNRCLYIFAQKIYEKGTKDAPHRGHACGTDVTSVMPSSHIGNVVKYLDPNYRTDICPAITPTNTPIPPTSTPLPTATVTPPPQPTSTTQPVATSKPVLTFTPKPTATTTPTPTPITPTIAQATPTIDGIPASIAVRLTPAEVIPTSTLVPTMTSELIPSVQPDTPPPAPGVPRNEFFASLSIGAWWGLVLTLASVGTFFSTLLIGLVKVASSTISANLMKINTVTEKPQIVNSQGVARGEVFEKLFYVTHFGTIDTQKSWVSLTSDNGQQLGMLLQPRVTDGFYKVSGRKTSQAGNDYIMIETLTPLEKNV